jgi:2-dehydro-3-deoxygalactonokinase
MAPPRAMTALIAIDWGTTAARAYRLDATGAVLDVRAAPLGIQQVKDGRFSDAFAALLGDWQEDPAPRLACGMIGSRQGWIEAPYVACPATLQALCDGIVQVPDVRLRIVPGITTRDGSGIPDVIRGEETQIVGAVGEREDRVLAAMPGTHSKWARVEHGEIVDFMTFMTGELYSVMLKHTILGRLAAEAPMHPGAGFARGAQRGLATGMLAHDMFGARTLALMGELAPEEVADWLSGLLIGREISDARRWANRHGYDGARVRVVGADALVARYELAFAQADVTVERADQHAAAHGLWRIAVHAGLVTVLNR